MSLENEIKIHENSIKKLQNLKNKVNMLILVNCNESNELLSEEDKNVINSLINKELDFLEGNKYRYELQLRAS